MQPIDQLIIPKWLVPIDDAKSVLENHALAILDDRIVAIDAIDTLRASYNVKSEITLPEHVLMPGFVNAHTHAAMTLLRGYADDLPLMEWWNEYIFPAEAKFTAQYIEVGTNLALAEMIRSGTTCFNDMYLFPEVVAACVEKSGMRACLGMIVIDTPTTWAQDADEYIRKGVELRDATRHSTLITTAFAPHAPYSVSNKPLERIRTLADEMDCQIHLHVHETNDEIEKSIAQYKMRPLARLEQLGLLGPRLIAVHMTQLLPDEIKLVAERDVKIVHCPQSNLKLASGLCPLAKLLESGATIAIGTDGASSNNDLDMLNEMQTASLLAKGVSENPATLPAHAALEAATLGGAKALGLEHKIGSLTPGKQADMIAIDLSAPATQPVYHPVSPVVYSASRDQISDVWVNGKRLLENHELMTLDQTEIVAKATEVSRQIASAR